MQRFLRKPVRVTLSTLLGVYRGVMRLSSVAGALDDAIEKDPDNKNEAEDLVQGRNVQAEKAERSNTGDSITGRENLSGGLLMRKHLIGPLQQVGR